MTDTSPFTPRTTPRPAPRVAAAAPLPAPVHEKTPERIWKHRLITCAKWMRRQLRYVWVRLVRYVRGLTKAQRLLHGAIVLGLIICLFVFNQIFSRSHQAAQTVQIAESGAALPQEIPSFSTILPAGRSAKDVGGWRRVSPSDRNPVYAYPDMLAGISIIVSEQPLPDTFRSDISSSIEKLSESYSASRTFEVDGTTVHIGKSAKGPQSLIFTKHDLLVLIKSAAAISDDQWQTYIKSLQ